MRCWTGRPHSTKEDRWTPSGHLGDREALCSRGPGLGLWLVRPPGLSSPRAGWEMAGAGLREREVEARTQRNLGDTREDTWGARGEADLSAELPPHLGLQVLWLLRGTQPSRGPQWVWSGSLQPLASLPPPCSASLTRVCGHPDYSQLSLCVVWAALSVMASQGPGAPAHRGHKHEWLMRAPGAD